MWKAAAAEPIFQLWDYCVHVNPGEFDRVETEVMLKIQTGATQTEIDQALAGLVELRRKFEAAALELQTLTEE